MADRAIYPDTIVNAGLDIEPADTTTLQDLVTGAAAAGGSTGGTSVDKIICTSDDTAEMTVQLWYYDTTNTNAHLLGSVTIPIGAGTTGVIPAVSILNQTSMPWLGDDLSYLLAAGDKLQASVLATVTTAKTVSLVLTGGDY